MRILFILIVFIFSCSKATNSSANKTSTSKQSILDKLQGTWEYCSISGGTDGDSKLSYNFNGNVLTFDEYYYQSTDGSCSNPLTHATFSALVSFPNLYPTSEDMVSVNYLFTSNYKIKSLTTNSLAINRVKACTGLTTVSNQTSYFINQANCNFETLAKTDRNWAGLTLYSILSIDRTGADTAILLGTGAGTRLGWSASDRFDSLYSVSYFQY